LDRNGALNVLGESMSDLSKTHIPLNATTPEKMSELIKLILNKGLYQIRNYKQPFNH
jgi:hypothetical protein